MLTKNWYAAIAARMLGGNGRFFSGRMVHGATANMYPADSFKPANYIQTLNTDNSTGVILGTGNTPATPDDYKLAGDTITTFSYSSNGESKETDKGYECNATYTITNTGTSAFTISEIGFLMPLYTSSSGSDGKMLIERTVLDNPLTIEAGGIGVLTYTIRMNYPT